MNTEKELTGYPSIDKPWEKGKSFFQKHPIIPSINIYSLIKQINKKNMDAPAITCHDETYTYREMLQDSVKLANALVINGINRGDIIAICMPSYYEAAIVFLACNKIGAIFTCLNNHASISEIQSYINLYHTPVLFTDRTDLVELLNNGVMNTVVLVKTDKLDKKKGAVHYADYIKKGSSNWKGGITFNGKDDALILYTSGTTGKPKSVVLTNINIISSIIYEKNTATDIEINVTRTLTCVPFSYPYGLITSLITSLLWQKEAVLAPFIGMDTVQYYMSYKPNMIFGSPALLNLIMKGIPDDFELAFVTSFVSGGDFLPANQAEQGKVFFKKHGSSIEIGNGFGNAETVSNGSTPVGVESRPSTVGKILTGTDVMIVDPNTYKERHYNEEGLMLATGKHIFREYYHDPEATKAAKRTINGREYFITGTMGFIDKDGYFTLTGRQSRFYINSSLNKIYLDHVQKIVGDLNCVEACAIVKVPDKTELFVNKAYIVLKDNYKPNEEMKQTIIDKLKESPQGDESETLKSHEIPTYIEFLDKLPLMEGSEKVDYLTLEKMAEEMEK